MKAESGMERTATIARPRPVRFSRRTLFVLLVLALGWGLLMRQFGGADVYAVMGPYALSVIAVGWLLTGKRLLSLFVPSARVVALGVGIGALMVLATYPMFHLAVGLFPALLPEVEKLYAAARTTHLAWAVAWVSVLVLAEELLWRGLLLDALASRTTPRAALLLSVTTYALAQLGSGSGVVFLLAAVCGVIWTVQRCASESLLAPLISHLIWTESVIVLWPVI